jgi:CubicO group peptidase (beta-lactamase class C family)
MIEHVFQRIVLYSSFKDALMRNATLILCSILCFLGSLAPAQAHEKIEGARASKIHELLSKYHDYGLFNGSALVAERGKVIYKAGHGEANMEWLIPNTPDTLFRIGSITKQFTSMVIMQLVEEGQIELQAAMSKYLPDYRKDTGERVTIHQLLTHTSGILSYTSKPEFRSDVSRNPYKPHEFVEEHCSDDLEFEPGSEFRYNNSGYFLLGAIIEAVTGQSYEDALRERIFDRIGMHSSGYDHHATVLKKRASGYERKFEGYINAPYLDMSLPYAGGSLYSTVEDLYRWDRALYSTELISKKSRSKMFDPFLKKYAYGWGVRDVLVGETGKTVRGIGHGGGINGFNTRISRLVDDQHLIVLLNNTGGQPLGEMTGEIISILYDQPHKLPTKPIVPDLVRMAINESVAGAAAHFESWKKNNAEKVAAVEPQINRAGYGFLQSGSSANAIRVFELNVTLFPNSANVYDSLAEALALAGQREAAIRNYKTSLELNPENSNATEQLEKLKVPENTRDRADD